MNRVKISYPFNISFIDYPSNDWCVIVYFMGCDFTCKNCQNPNFQFKDYDKNTIDFTLDLFYLQLKKSCEENITNKVVFSGGDPLSTNNYQFTKEFLKIYHSEFDVCIYTGLDINLVKERKIENFKFIKSGCFDLSQLQISEKKDNYISLASKNQKIYNHNFELLSTDGIYIFKQQEND